METKLPRRQPRRQRYGPYNILSVDCPWPYDNEKDNDPKSGGMTYPTMTIEDLKALPVKDLAAKNCLLFMWATMPKLPEAIEVMRAWGFVYTTCAFTWVKLNPSGKGIYSGLGHWTNGNAELCLMGKVGAPKRHAKNVKQILMAPRGRHSAKPPEALDRMIQLAGDLPRIELFCRDPQSGWDALGHGVDGRDIRETLDEMLGKHYAQYDPQVRVMVKRLFADGAA